MRSFRQIAKLLLYLKGRLPQNGDWLFVTESTSSESPVDAAEGYRQPSAVLKELSETASTEEIKLIYDRAKSFESTVGEIANRVYDKSKVLFGAASFASTILLALGSALLPPLLAGSTWLSILGISLSVLLVLHLGRSLVIAASVMTREVIVHETPSELFGLSTKKAPEIFRELIAKTVAYSVQTQAYGQEKLNRLITAQTSFRYALVYYFIIAVLSVGVRFGVGNVEGPSVRALDEDLKALKRNVELLNLTQENLSTSVDHIKNEQTSAQQELRISYDLRKSELDVLRDIEAQLRKAQEISSPSAPRGSVQLGRRN